MIRRREFITLLGGAAAWRWRRARAAAFRWSGSWWTVARLRRLSGGKAPSGLARQRFYRGPKCRPRVSLGRRSGWSAPALTAELIERKVAVLSPVQRMSRSCHRVASAVIPVVVATGSDQLKPNWSRASIDRAAI
jgi:hypothetical protein